MRVLMLDDSFEFDGSSTVDRPMGGAEKAFANLATALAGRGHEVTAINQCTRRKSVNNVSWLPFDSPRPPETDVLIAFRKPNLLQEQDDHKRRIFWLWGAPKILNQPANQALLEKYDPIIVFTGEANRRAWKSWRDFSGFTIVPGLADAYLGDQVPMPAEPPVAIVTTHPLHNLDAIIDLWQGRIHPKIPGAELHIYSASLAKAASGGEVNKRLAPVFDKAKAAENAGVRLKQPLADSKMVAVYYSARVHLYPVIKDEYYCSTLAESQSCGLPAVVGQFGGVREKFDLAPIYERVQNGLSGYIAPDNDAFVNLSLELLDDDKTMYESLSRDAKILQSDRDWQTVAIDFEKLFK